MVLTQPVWPCSMGASRGITRPRSVVAAEAGAAAGSMAAAPAAQARAMEAVRRIVGSFPGSSSVDHANRRGPGPVELAAEGDPGVVPVHGDSRERRIAPGRGVDGG